MEYEYSFNVTSINEYINYCVKNNYKKEKEVKQTRIIYRNCNGTMARITIDKAERVIKKIDFKEDKLSKCDLNIRKESLSLEFDDEKAIKSILNFLDYKEDNTLVRTRIVYKKEDVIFEIDKYEKPSKELVVAIEGNEKKVNEVYKELKSINEKYKK